MDDERTLRTFEEWIDDFSKRTPAFAFADADFEEHSKHLKQAWDAATRARDEKILYLLDNPTPIRIRAPKVDPKRLEEMYALRRLVIADLKAQLLNPPTSEATQ